MSVVVDFFTQKDHGVSIYTTVITTTIAVGGLVITKEVKSIQWVGGSIEYGGGDAGADGLEGEGGVGGVFGVELLAFGGVWFGGDCFD